MRQGLAGSGKLLALGSKWAKRMLYDMEMDRKQPVMFFDAHDQEEHPRVCPCHGGRPVRVRPRAHGPIQVGVRKGDYGNRETSGPIRLLSGVSGSQREIGDMQMALGAPYFPLDLRELSDCH